VVSNLNCDMLQGRDTGSFVSEGGDTMTGLLKLPSAGLEVGDKELKVAEGGNVGIGVDRPSNLLTLKKLGGSAIADGWTTYSSARWKDNIQPIQDPIETLQRLRGVSFDWKADGHYDIGLVAEEVGAVVPKVVAFEGNGFDARSVDYARVVALLIEAIKEQQKEIEELKSAVAAR